ncbi:DUF397 domain-containing protein [Streptomonospora algeriensis]|uniref:DUF397 domain-containing protein n=1 Tax=Streptomonospora algeriensis TaxID=995084 RepID=A0ABW3BE32_9ACTN
MEETRRTSSCSDSKGGECVEVAATSDRGAGHLEMPSAEWTAFVAAVGSAEP